ncbi:MAG: translocase [Terriglobia bacterium]|nr:MAG: translocase [Terriglobia bacterium]
MRTPIFKETPSDSEMHRTCPSRGWQRFLRYLADVHPGEVRNALLLTATVFLLLFAYYLLKTVREALILSEGGAYIKAYSSAGQAFLLMVLVPVYGLVASKVVRIKLLGGLLLFFFANLVLFSALGASGAREGVVFYIWVGIFNVFIVSQVWAFANDIYTEGQGKRLFPIIGLGSSLGAWLGARGAERMVAVLHASPYQLQLLAASILLICGGLLVTVNRGARRSPNPEMAARAAQTLAPGDGFAMIFKDRYLMWIAVLIVLLNMVNSTGEFLLGDLVSSQARALHPGNLAAQKQFIGSFYGSFFADVNLLGLLLQVFAVSRIVPRYGVRAALYILPVISLACYSAVGLAPLLGLIRWGKTLENATDYSIQNTLRQALFLPTSREAKYKAKAAIDTFFMRLGDVLHAGLVRLGSQLHLAFAGYAWINVGLTVGWLYAVSRLARQHHGMTAQEENERPESQKSHSFLTCGSRFERPARSILSVSE